MQRPIGGKLSEIDRIGFSGGAIVGATKLKKNVSHHLLRGQSKGNIGEFGISATSAY
jgi:hypothetical protein